MKMIRYEKTLQLSNSARLCRHRGAFVVGIAVASLALTAWSSRAGALCDFNHGPAWDGENDPSGLVDFEIADQQLRIAANFTMATNPENPFNTFGNVYYLTNLPVRQRQTLDLRVELVSANQDNVFACLVTMNASKREYAILKDQNEIGLLKWSATEGSSLAFWESRSIPNQDVLLVLTLTPEGDRLVIGTKVVDKVTQRVLYEKQVTDGPGSDWPVPSPAPHGWKILTADAGQPYMEDLTLVGLAMQQQTDGLQGLAEVRLDNLEYDTYPSPHLDIGAGVILAWPENTAEQQIVVGADSLASNAVWAPWPEPSFKDRGALCVTAPPTAPQRFYRLVPGVQYMDDFSDPQQPFANRNPWRLTWNLPGDEFVVTNGILRLNWNGPEEGRFLAQPPGSDVVVSNFYCSVDILDWQTTNTSWSDLGIIARGHLFGGGSGVAYGGGLNLIGGSVVKLWMSYGSYLIKGTGFNFGEIPPPYRVEFSAVGAEFLLRVINLKTKQIIEEMTMTHTTRSQGFVGLWVDTPAVNGSQRIIVDNFFVTGTKP